MKIKVISNYRVVVWPDFIWDKEEDAAKRMLKDIERHIDMKDATVIHDEDWICEFCKSSWEEEDDGCPLCCQKAVDEWEKSRIKPEGTF
jgi:rubrerythrin